MIIVGAIALVLVLAVGYALFSETITVSGTATANGTFDVEFTTVGTITKVGYTAQDATPITEISNDKNTLNIHVNKLDYPGAYVEIPVTITNKGSIPAKLKNIVETGLPVDNTIKVTYSGVATTDAALEANATSTLVIKVEWDSSKNATATDVSFSLELEYEQITVPTTVQN